MRISSILTTLLILLFGFKGFSQDSSNIVSWTASSKRTSAKTYDLIITGNISNGWHVYAKPDLGVGLAGMVINVKSATVNADTLTVLSPLSPITDLIFDNTVQQVAKEKLEFRLPIHGGDTIPSELRLQLIYEVGKGKDS